MFQSEFVILFKKLSNDIDFEFSKKSHIRFDSHDDDDDEYVQTIEEVVLEGIFKLTESHFLLL
jgi:hypothetical protein